MRNSYSRNYCVADYMDLEITKRLQNVHCNLDVCAICSNGLPDLYIILHLRRLQSKMLSRNTIKVP